MKPRNLIFLILTSVAVWMVYGPLRDLLGSNTHSEYYSHIMLIPLVSAYFFYKDRKGIFFANGHSYALGLVFLLAGIFLYELGRSFGNNLNKNDYTSLMVFATLIFWVGGFIFSYGWDTLRKALFPVVFLFFIIPIPSLLMDQFIYSLQKGSTEVVEVIFKLLGLSFFREEFVFQLAGANIEVAKQCSGIRSTLALFITGILAGHLFLRTGWKKGVLILSLFPITIIKNGIRIVTLTLLGIHVDMNFLTGGFLHKSGGFIFYIPALVLLGGVLWFLRKSEIKKGLRTEIKTQ